MNGLQIPLTSPTEDFRGVNSPDSTTDISLIQNVDSMTISTVNSNKISTGSSDIMNPGDASTTKTTNPVKKESISGKNKSKNNGNSAHINNATTSLDSKSNHDITHKEQNKGSVKTNLANEPSGEGKIKKNL